MKSHEVSSLKSLREKFLCLKPKMAFDSQTRDFILFLYFWPIGLQKNFPGLVDLVLVQSHVLSGKINLKGIEFALYSGEKSLKLAIECDIFFSPNTYEFETCCYFMD